MTEKEILERIVDDFKFFARNFLWIKNEYGEIVKFKFNFAQEVVFEKVWAMWKKGRPIRLIVLKARQQGISTLIQAFIFWILFIYKNQKALTMGHKVDASNNLFDMFRRYYDHLPIKLKRGTVKSNEKKLAMKNGSENKIDTAGTGEVGRSDTFQAVHLTEVAFYPDTKTTLVSLMQGSKYSKVTVIESTANGFNEFHNMWQRAVSGESGFIPIFLSWKDFPEYVIEAKKNGFIKELDAEEREEFIKDLGNIRFNEFPEQEKFLLEQGVTLDQLQWRRYAIANLCDGDLLKFRQEYPLTPEEAFVSTGTAVFDQNICMRNKVASVKGKRGDLVVTYDTENEKYRKLIAEGKTTYEDLKDYIKDVEFIESSKGWVTLWDEPIKDDQYRYSAGVDVAEGLEQGDYSVISVYDRIKEKTALRWHGHIDPDLLSEEMHKIWLFLGKDCHFAVEKNNHGLTVINKAYKLGIPLYYRQKYNKGYETSSKELGFVTSSKSKPFMINMLNEWIRDGLFTDLDERLWSECLTFVKNARGQMQAQDKDKDPSVKCYDDIVMSTGLMLVCSSWLPNPLEYTEPEVYARSFIKNKTKRRGDTRF